MKMKKIACLVLAFLMAGALVAPGIPEARAESSYSAELKLECVDYIPYTDGTNGTFKVRCYIPEGENGSGLTAGQFKIASATNLTLTEIEKTLPNVQTNTTASEWNVAFASKDPVKIGTLFTATFAVTQGTPGDNAITISGMAWCETNPVTVTSVTWSGEPAGIAAGDFLVSGGTKGTDWTYDADEKTLNILTGTALTIAMKDGVAKTANRIMVATGVTGNLTLDGVHIETSSSDGAVGAAGDLNLTLVGKNVVQDTGNRAGIWAGIDGEGNLNLYGDGGLETNWILCNKKVSICGNVTVKALSGISSNGVSFDKSTQASVNAITNSAVSTPTRDGKETCLLTIENPNSEKVTIDGVEWTPCNSRLLGDTTLYAYVTKPTGDIVVTVGSIEYLVRYDEGTKTFSKLSAISYSRGTEDGVTGNDPATGTKASGETYKLPGETYQREGFVQDGWKDQNGTTYPLFGEYTGDISLKLEPTWVAVVELKIPFQKTVEQKHNEKPGKTTFNLDMTKIEGESTTGETEHVKVTASVETNGKGNYDSFLYFKGPAAEILNFVGDGLYVREMDDGLKNWEYDDTVYYVTVGMDDDGKLEYTIYGTKSEKNGEDTYTSPDTDKELDRMTFTNQYVKKTTTADLSNPKCGDEIGLAVAVMVSTGCALALLARKRRKA